jgi:hypothetical protein
MNDPNRNAECDRDRDVNDAGAEERVIEHTSRAERPEGPISRSRRAGACRDGDGLGVKPGDQPCRAFQRGLRLLITKLRPRRLTTIDPSFCLSDLREFLAFIVPSSR